MMGFSKYGGSMSLWTRCEINCSRPGELLHLAWIKFQSSFTLSGLEIYCVCFVTPAVDGVAEEPLWVLSGYKAIAVLFVIPCSPRLSRVEAFRSGQCRRHPLCSRYLLKSGSG
jgi:hypothetical protein